MALVEVRITAPDEEVADRIARALVDRRLAACVQQLPAITSTYRWQGETERASEILLLAKTTVDRFDALSSAVVELHPYDTPEILAVPVDRALSAYRDWVLDSVATDPA